MRPQNQIPRQNYRSQYYPNQSFFENARRYAERLGEKLSYIPQRERDLKYWITSNVYQDPKQGTLHWHQGNPPKLKSALKRSNMFIVDNIIGNSVASIVHVAKQERETKWKVPAEEVEEI